MVSAPNANNGLGNSFYYKEGGNTSKQDILELISSEWVTLGQEGIVIACLQSFQLLKTLISRLPSSLDVFIRPIWILYRINMHNLLCVKSLLFDLLNFPPLSLCDRSSLQHQVSSDVEYAGYSSVFCDINGDGVKEMILGMPRSMNYHGSIKIHYGK